MFLDVRFGIDIDVHDHGKFLLKSKIPRYVPTVPMVIVQPWYQTYSLHHIQCQGSHHKGLEVDSWWQEDIWHCNISYSMFDIITEIIDLQFSTAYHICCQKHKAMPTKAGKHPHLIKYTPCLCWHVVHHILPSVRAWTLIIAISWMYKWFTYGLFRPFIHLNSR